ncbi:MAG TPA: SDR family oxidoreductase [Myxococcales bacterium]|nr:SDR family oxidoreductase [Myxococcales bacterium]
MTARIALVTGGTSGLGKAAAQALAAEGAAVILVARDPARGLQVQRELRAATGNQEVHALAADLSSMESVRGLAGEVRRRWERLDVLINCAGAIYRDRQLSADGYELTFALNHLGHFLLTNLLLDRLEAAGRSRIVNVASEAHRPNAIDFQDLHSARSYGYSGDLFRPTAYGRTKLANILFTYELARRLQGTGVTANCVHPGFVASGFGRNNPGLLTFAFTLLRPLAASPRAGAEPLVYLACSPEVEGVSGGYFIKKKPARSSPASYDAAAAERLWAASAELTGLPPTAPPGPPRG